MNNSKTGIHLGNRDEIFKNFINNTLIKGKVSKVYRDMLTEPDSMSLYAQAFTSETIDSVNNYQILEQLGDLTGNKFIVTYMYERFPKLRCTDGVNIVARLRNKYGAKLSFSEFARKLGFWEYISATVSQRSAQMKSLLEDVFEAFLGATEQIVDRHRRIGVGYAVVYDFLATIFDDIHISLEYNDLFDPITRLKELMDVNSDTLGTVLYEERVNNEHKYAIFTSTAYRITKYNRRIPIGNGTGSLKHSARQCAAKKALAHLEKYGYVKKPPAIYDIINNRKPHTQKPTVDYIISKWGPYINEQTNTENKYRYTSTPIASYLRHRNPEAIQTCLQLGATLNIKDSDGLYPTDLLFIGTYDESIVRKIYKIISAKCNKIPIHKSIYDMYGRKYITIDKSYLNVKVPNLHICNKCKKHT